ncbi:MAG TPA: cysteine synthase A [Alphaproteobacteria bacterium]|nr:cysteine synthase A [Alphaproteobacteria bacterium]
MSTVSDSQGKSRPDATRARDEATEKGRGRVYESILETVGNTPLVHLPKLSREQGCQARILAKLEFFNPLASVKDRIGLAMIEAAEAEGRMSPKTVVVEPTSGNTGIALAFVCAAKGYRLILCMPESMSLERRKMLMILGAEIELTPANRGMQGAVARAQELTEQIKDSIMLQQFENPANPDIHARTTGEEIWNDTGGEVDAVVAGVGTGGTIAGVGPVLKARKPDVKMIAVEPEDSAVLSGGIAGPHKIQGIGAGFVPKILDTEIIDEVLRIGNETAFATSRLVAKLEGVPVGISSGAALAAALEIGARQDFRDKSIVVIIPSFAERYLSTALFDNL